MKVKVLPVRGLGAGEISVCGRLVQNASWHRFLHWRKKGHK